MPSTIIVKTPHSTIAEDAAILTAFNTFLAAVKSATAFRADAGGTIIGGVAKSGDEAGGAHLPHGQPW